MFGEATGFSYKLSLRKCCKRGSNLDSRGYKRDSAKICIPDSMLYNIHLILGTASGFQLTSGRGVLITTGYHHVLLTVAVDIGTNVVNHSRKENMFSMICAFLGPFLLLRFISPVIADEFAEEDENTGYVVS